MSGIDAQTQPNTTAIDQAVISKLSAQFGINSKVILHLDLTQPFQTKSRWNLVVAKQPDEESSVEDGAGNRIGAVSFCFVENDEPDCSEEMLLAKYREAKVSFVSGEPTFHELIASDVVFSGPGRTLPLVSIKSCMNSGANGNCGVSTFLFAYDRKTAAFRVVFFNIMGRNNNQETRLVENGPLLGSVIVWYPADDPPFRYFVEVYRRISGGEYSQVLKYRGNTGYGDGNPLAVIDSEMPETLRRLGLWKTGDALPVPARLPGGCTRLVMRKGVESCEQR
ncbi:MAG: hypothetical protein M3N54_07200 [Acidobacteriota bacterium]|nr:hypothetical protein [Acidobacteriota bacterium]